MGGFFQERGSRWFVWRSPFSAEMQFIIVMDTNPKGDVTINDLDLPALLTQVQLFPPNMYTLAHTRTAVDNTEVQVWYNRGSVSSAIVVSPIIRYLALLKRTHKIYSSVHRITSADNKMADAASRLTHLTDKIFLQHFALTLPQINHCRLITLPSG